MMLSYRDPLLGLIEFFLFIFAISAITYIYSIYRQKIQNRSYQKLLKRFNNGYLKEQDYVKMYQNYNLSFESIMLLSSTLNHQGDITKTINIYISLLKIVKNSSHKEQVLENLGRVYLQAGMLQRAKDIFEKVIKFSPTNIKALNSLLIIYEKLNLYKETKEIIDVLNELNIDTTQESFYIDAVMTIHDPLQTTKEKSTTLTKLLKQNKNIQRLVASYLIQNDIKLFWRYIDMFEPAHIVDMLWFMTLEQIDQNSIKDIKFLIELYTAKGYIKKATKSDDFHLDIIIRVRENGSNRVDLAFKYICSYCKKSSPLYQDRCQFCHHILTIKPTFAITNKTKEEKHKEIGSFI